MLLVNGRIAGLSGTGGQPPHILLRCHATQGVNFQWGSTASATQFSGPGVACAFNAYVT